MNPSTDSAARHFFKYEYGYINIDSRNIYLTNSGNWQETVGMEEKSKKTIRHSDRRKWWILTYLLIGCFMEVALHFLHAISSTFGVILLITIPASCLPLYRYMQSEIGPRFLIPIKKVKSIEDVEGGVTIHFQTEVYAEDSVFVKYPRGLDKEYLEELLSISKPK